MTRSILYAVRVLLRYPGYLSLNLMGLGLGVACAFLAMLFAWQEYGVDRYFPKGDRIYRVGCSFMNMGEFANGPEALIPYLQADCPSLEGGTRLKKYSTETIRIGDHTFEAEDVLYTDSSFFRIFDYPFVAGNKTEALRSADQVILSEKMARKYFGGEQALGQIIQAGEEGQKYRVAGIVGEMPHRSHLDGNIWLPIYRKLQNKEKPEWYSAAFYNYVCLRPHTGAGDLAKSLDRITRKHIYPKYGGDTPYETWAASQSSFRWVVQPFRDIYLRSRLNFEVSGGGDPDKVAGLLLIGSFILLIAMVNYINLVTARAAVRARSIGIRKTLGIHRSGLVRELLLESAIVGLGAAAVGLVSAEGLLFVFKKISGSDLLDLSRYRTALGIGIVLFAVPASILTGIYPALFLSHFKPADVLKGEWNPSGKKTLRSALVVGQFTIALALLIASLGIFRQLKFMAERDWGFRRAGICVVENTNVLGEKAAAFRRELARLQGVESSSLSGSLPAGNTTFFQTYQTTEMPEPVSVKSYMVDADFIPTLGLSLKEGRNFNAEMPGDTAAVVVNESAVKTLGLGAQPLGAEVNKGAKVIGVVRDFNYETLRNPIGPLVLQYVPNRHYYAVGRIAPAAQAHFIQAAEAIWNQFAPDKPFSYYFLDESLAELSAKETAMGQGILFFTGLAFFIACLGLFGLATFLTSRRTREIGIRKVLGASTAGIVRFLSADFLKPVFWAFLIATPVAWLGLQRWLDGFAYRTTLSWWIPLCAGLSTLALAFATVSIQSLRAAMTDPARVLRTE